ncbi:hypothetical protein AXG93_1593s1250 [Marchantia polymorpha subsp. ruderalis]|uniref:Uncharacterized protein n=1 Tax=Marchantia polymorpha subsp. ruderalis TaxID=1480154 RepID=A0A176WPG3_MARPO|nr:hypothetical protein AXG93_1593s1250 [Marchantia polymorpha subsp. ruderalis]
MFVITQNILAQRKEGRRKEQVSAEIGALPSSVYFQASALYLPLFRWYGKTLNPVCGHCSEFPSFEPGEFSDTVLVRECDETVLRIESSMWRTEIGDLVVGRCASCQPGLEFNSQGMGPSVLLGNRTTQGIDME